jgi:predicted ATP-grasp superfamily ATP-dependent carboligase
VLHSIDSYELLPPTQQLFDAAPFGQYIGAAYPLEPLLADRATALAAKVVQALPPTRGYFGIDMILGEHPDSPDYAIEVNPRLTMSYLKLREVCGFNIADRIVNRLTSPTDLIQGVSSVLSQP